MPRRKLNQRLDEWRDAERARDATADGTAERQEASTVARHAGYAYEDESLRVHGAHGIAETMRHRNQRLRKRSSEMTTEAHEAINRTRPPQPAGGSMHPQQREIDRETEGP